MKLSWIMLMVAGTGSCQASFELLLAVDAGTTAPGSARVHRIDGVTGASLGTFGANILSSPRGIAVDPASGRCYVSELGRGYQVFDYNTGIHYGRIAGDFASERHPILLNGKLYATGTSMTAVNASTGATTVIGLPTGFTAATAMVQLNTKDLAVRAFNPTTFESRFFRFDTATNAFTALGGVIVDPTASNPVDAIYIPSYASGGPAIFAGLDATSGDFVRYDQDASNNVLGRTLVDSAPLNEIVGATHGHGGFFISGALASDSSRGGIQYLDYYGSAGTTFTLSGLNTPKGLASVVAPEPSSVALLGLGASLLAVRRIKR